MRETVGFFLNKALSENAKLISYTTPMQHEYMFYEFRFATVLTNRILFDASLRLIIMADSTKNKNFPLTVFL